MPSEDSATMFPFIFIILFYSSGILSEEPTTCTSEQIDECVSTIPRSLRGPRPHALPVSRQEIETLCSAYTKAMKCIETWTRRCLPTETLEISEKQTVGAKQVMKFLCHDESFKRDYLNHTTCFRAVSGDWERCLAQLHASTRFVSVRGRAPFYVDVQGELCCIREEFQQCVGRAGRAKCSRASAVMLRRVAETLGNDGMLTPHCRRLNCAGAASLSSTVLLVLVNLLVSFVVLG